MAFIVHYQLSIVHCNLRRDLHRVDFIAVVHRERTAISSELNDDGIACFAEACAALAGDATLSSRIRWGYGRPASLLLQESQDRDDSD